VKAYLLYDGQDFDAARQLAFGHEDLIQDLELTAVLRAMAAGDEYLLDIATKVTLTSLTDPAAIRYRQSVLADCIAEPQIIREMYDIAVGALKDKRRLWGYFSSQSPGAILSSAVGQLDVLIARLRQLRKIADEHPGKFRSEGLTTLFRTLQRELDDDYFETLGHHLKQLRFRDGELMSVELDRDNSGINYMLRSGGGRRTWKERVGLAPRSSYSFAIPPRDEAGARALSEMTSRGLNLVANAAAQSADHVSSYFAMLRAELGFYVGCLNLRDRLVGQDQPVSFPVPFPSESWKLTCSDLRDASLALHINRVVGNDVDAVDRPLMLITGANSGGKSTFLRSLGLAQLMMQCGMYVTAKSYEASVCTQIFTHFIREEDPAMISGRLDAELSRLSSIADHLSPHSLMLFNESFAATNEREGSEIGRQVVRALLEADVRVCFVTHQFDLADSLRRERPDTTACLRAEREPDGSRSFRLAVGAPEPTSHAEDIYYRIGGWMGERVGAGEN
jgi:MutS domain V